MELKDDFRIEIIDTDRNLRVTTTLAELRAFLLPGELIVPTIEEMPEHVNAPYVPLPDISDPQKANYSPKPRRRAK